MKKIGYIYYIYDEGLCDMEILIMSSNKHMLIKNTYNTHYYPVGKIGTWSGGNWEEKGSAFNYYLKLL